MQFGRFSRAGLLSLGVALVAAPPALAAPPSPQLIKAWRQSDQLLAKSDLAGSLAAITPVLAQRDSLDANSPARAWFDLSAARILALTAGNDQASSFLSDLASISAYWGGQYIGSTTGEGLITFSRRVLGTPNDAACSAYQGLGQRLEGDGQSLIGDTVLFGIMPLTSDGTLLSGRSVLAGLGAGGTATTYPFPTTPAQLRSLWADDRFGATKLSGVPNSRVGLPSYFATLNTKAFGRNTDGIALCNEFVVRTSGSPYGVARVNATSTFAAAIPSTTPLVAKRRIAARAPFAVQVFGADGRTATAIWKRRDGHVTRSNATIAASSVTLTAPSKRGAYNLIVSIAGDHGATEVTGVGVGVSAPRSGYENDGFL